MLRSSVDAFATQDRVSIHRFAALDNQAAAGDRIEIYRPLRVHEDRRGRSIRRPDGDSRQRAVPGK